MAKAKADPYLIQQDIDSRTATMLTTNGAPQSAFMRSNYKLDLATSAIPIAAEITGCPVRRISVKKQLTAYEQLANNPLRGHPLFVISSFPTESRSSVVALHLMSLALRAYYQSRQSGNSTMSNREVPYWHRLMAGYKDEIPRDKRPCMLLLSNITEASSAARYEKLRDLLVSYEDTPRIVVTAGCDPLVFCLEWLRLTPDGVLYLGPDDAVSRNQSL